MKKDLISLGFDLEDDGTDSLNIALDDLSYFIEINSFKKKPLPESEREGLMELIDVSEKKEFEQYLEKQDQLRNRRIQEELQKRTTNQFGIRQKQIPKVPELPKQLVR